MQVGPDHVPVAYPFQAVAAVVTEALDHATEGGLAVPEIGAAAVVLEARDHLRAVGQVGLDGAVADQARAWLADGAQGDQPDTGPARALHLVLGCGELVAGAAGGHGGAA